MSASGQAHAKLILMGEHFVVPFADSRGIEHPGSHALAVPLPALKTQVRLSKGESTSCEIDPSNEDLGFGEDAAELMSRALRYAADRFSWDLGKSPLKAYSVSNFPCSRGLGSSASFSVALSRAFREMAGADREDLHADAQAIENLFHGKSSGLDTSAILSDVPILYRSGKVLAHFNPTAVDLVVADSGPRAASATLVGRTLALRKENPDRWLALGERVSDLVHACMSAIQKPDGAHEVARSIREAQEILAEVGLMNRQLDELLAIGTRMGALAGKMSGAGSGGIAFFIARPGEGAELAGRMRDAQVNVITTFLAGTAS